MFLIGIVVAASIITTIIQCILVDNVVDCFFPVNDPDVEFEAVETSDEEISSWDEHASNL